MPDELLFRLRDVQALKRPSERNQGSLYQEVKRSIVDAENEWILQSDDLAAVAQDAEHGWFNVALESFLNSLSRKALFVSRTSLPFENLFGMTIKYIKRTTLQRSIVLHPRFLSSCNYTYI